MTQIIARPCAIGRNRLKAIGGDMTTYRLNVIDRAGHVVDVYEPDCVSDEEAFHKADTLAQGRTVDVWQGERWIALLDGSDPVRIALSHHVPGTSPGAH